MKKLTTLFVYAFYIFCFPIFGKTQANPDDSLALVTLYNSTDGANWTNSWDLMQPVSDWYGVTLDGDGSAIGLNLGSNQLNGAIPSELGNLTNLQSLSLGVNQLNGNIPTELGNLINLQSLNLNFNALSGNIPSEFGNLTKLRSLSMFNNQLSGNIPPELGSLTNLTWLSLNTNQLSGNIPPELSSLIKLKYFGLFKNQLTGSIPSELGSLVALESLVLAFNQLSGNLPPELANLTNSTFWNLGGNQFSGGIPVYLGDLTGLTYLGLFSNPLGGTIPPELGNLTNLTYLGLWNTQVSGSIPSELGKLTNLTQLSLPNNQLTGIIPAELGNLTDLTQLRLNDNQLEGCYHPNLMNLCSQLSFGDSLITIGNNFDASWEDFCNSGIGTCEISYNQSDSLTLVALYNATNGPNWTNTWNLSQPMSTWYGVTVNGEGCVTCLDLDGIGGCTPTQTNLEGNNLVGNIPIELGGLSQLENLSLAYNQLSGSIPSEMGNLSNLKFLVLNSNDLSGSIPAEIGNLNNLTELYLSRNNLSGTIPAEIGNMNSLQQLFLGGNQLTGEIPSALNNLNNLRSIVLLDNQLSGAIPDVLANMSALEYLILQDNQLSGTVPDLSNLTGLTLERNKFSHPDIATNYNVNQSIGGDFTYSPQYYSYEQHPANNIGQQVTLKPDPPIPYPTPSVRWLKDDNVITGDFTLHDTTYVIPSLDSMDIGVYEYQFIDYTLTPEVEFHSLPINNYIDGSDLEGEPVIPGELIIDFTNIPEDSIPIVQAVLAELGGEPIDSCGCNTPLYLYEFDDDVYSILDTLGKGESSTTGTDVDGGFNKYQDTPKRPDDGKLYIQKFFEPAEYQDNVVVACLDTGMDIAHQDIQGHLWTNTETNDGNNGCTGDIGGHGFNFIHKSGDIRDNDEHGTGVGGLIAKTIPSDADIQIMPVKVFDGDSLGTLFHLGCGIHYAIDNDADIINISLGYKGEKSSMLENVLQRAENEGIIVVTSAGNDGLNIDKEKYWPAGFANADDFDLSNVLTVAALDTEDNFWTESNYGPNTVNFAVRGERLSVPGPQNRQNVLTGTSASAPLATLALAMSMASDKNRSYQSIIKELNAFLEHKPALDTLVKGGRWLNIGPPPEEVINLDIKVLLEGACLTDNNYQNDMRTNLYNLNLLPLNEANTLIKHPFDDQLNGFSNDEWSDTPAYSPDVVDWVLLSLRENPTDLATTFYKTPAWLLRDGTLGLYAPIKSSDIDVDSFYVLVEHRNHLPVLSPIVSNMQTGIVKYDFSQQNSYTPETGSGQKEILPEVWAMYGANMSTNDGTFEDISGEDKAIWTNRNGNFYIYEPADANLDGDINGADKAVWTFNNGVFSGTPK